MLHILWDLDGTLVDSQQEILSNLKLAIEDSGLAVTDLKKPLRVGPTIDVILKESFPEPFLTEEKEKLVICNFRKRYDNSKFTATKPFDGIEEIIFDTKNFVHHIVTNKPDYPTERIVEKMGWGKYIRSISTPYSHYKSTGSRNKEKKKDKDRLFFEVISKYKDDTTTFVAVGDMQQELIAAKKNKIKAVGVLWGSGTRQELVACGCDEIVETSAQLNKILLACTDE